MNTAQEHTHPTHAQAMSALEAIHARRTIHRFQARAVSAELVERALEAGHMAPNHKLTWPWRFYVVGPETKAMMDNAALKMKSVNGPLEGASLELFKEKRIHPQLIIITQKRSTDPVEAKEDYAAVACAIQNICLSFTAEGVGTKWSTGSLTRSPQAYQLLNIDERVEEIVGFLWYGYATHTPSPKRPALSDVRRDLP